MVATPIDPAVLYANIFNETFYWVDTIADYTAPLRSELNAGTDLTPQVSNAAGWSTDGDVITIGNIRDGFDAQLPGKRTGGASSLMMNLSSEVGGTDIRSVVAIRDTGYIVRFDATDLAGTYMDVFPVRVNSMVKDPDAGAAGMMTVNFVITHNPAENVTVPA